MTALAQQILNSYDLLPDLDKQEIAAEIAMGASGTLHLGFTSVVGNAFLGGLRAKGFAASDISIIEKFPEARAKLVATYGVHASAEADATTAAADLAARFQLPVILVLDVSGQSQSAAVSGTFFVAARARCIPSAMR